MKTHPFVALVGFATLSFACSDHGPPTIAEYAEAFNAQLDALGSEQVAHSSEISGVTNIALIGSVELGHTQQMDDRLARMSRLIGGMMSCAAGTASTYDLTSFAVLTQDLHSECDEHAVLMLSAHEMDGIAAEEARHQVAVGMQVEKMRRRLSMTTQPGSGYGGCAPCPSCGM